MKLHDDTAFSRLGLSYGVDRSCVIDIFNAIINYAFVHDPDLRLQRNLDNAVWVVSFENMSQYIREAFIKKNILLRILKSL